MRKSLKFLCFTLSASLLLASCGKTGSSSSNESSPSSVASESASAKDSSSADVPDSSSSESSAKETVPRVKADPSKIVYADNYSFEKLKAEGIEKADYSEIYEAETAATDGVVLSTSKAGFSGEGYVDISNNPNFELKITVPTSQFYKITVRHCADSHKENPLTINGQTVMNIYSEKGDWTETVVDGIYIAKGENTVSLGSGWSYFSLDSIKIENGDAMNDDIYTRQADTLVNPYASLNAQNLYQYLKAVYGKRVIAGQCSNHGTMNEPNALYNGLGKYPALCTYDFIFDSWSSCKGMPQGKDVVLAKQWAKDGGIVAFDWHWYAPSGKSAFYAKDTDFRIENAMTDFDISMLDFPEVQKLYREDKIKIETVMIIADIDNISKLMQQLEDEDIPVLWRPLHEASGGWFWWGASGPENYKWLWKLLYERMTNYHGLDNLIWVWNAQNKDWYVGDEYCDIIATDIYNPEHDYSSSADLFAEMGTWSPNGKLITLSECGVMPDSDNIIRDNAYWLWFAVWNGEYLLKSGSITELGDKYTEVSEMQKIYDSELVITRDELPEGLKLCK